MSLNFHQVNVACQDLNLKIDRFAALSYAQEETDFSDPIQGIHGRIPFISLSMRHRSTLTLIRLKGFLPFTCATVGWNEQNYPFRLSEEYDGFLGAGYD
jgi:hypothetical protein